MQGSARVSGQRSPRGASKAEPTHQNEQECTQHLLGVRLALHLICLGRECPDSVLFFEEPLLFST